MEPEVQGTSVIRDDTCVQQTHQCIHTQIPTRLPGDNAELFQVHRCPQHLFELLRQLDIDTLPPLAWKSNFAEWVESLHVKDCG